MRSVLEQSFWRSSSSEIVSEYLHASISEIRWLVPSAGQFREWTVKLHSYPSGSRVRGLAPCVAHPERRGPLPGRALHRFPKRFKKSADYRFCVFIHGATPGGLLVHMRFRFQRFAAMSTAGDLASPCHLQRADAEWAAP